MRTIRTAVFLIGFAAPIMAQDKKLTPAQLAERTIHRRAVEAVIWGMSAVNYKRMLHATIANGAKANQVVEVADVEVVK